MVRDENYLRESIINSQAKIVKGYQPLMPAFQGLINEENLVALVEYLKTKSPAAKPTPAPAAAPAATTATTDGMQTPAQTGGKN